MANLSEEEKKERARQAQARYRAKNPGKYAEYMEARRRAAGKPKRVFLTDKQRMEREKQWQKKSRTKHKQKISKADAAYRAANVEKRREAYKAWLERNPGIERVYSQLRRARKKLVGGKLSTDIVERLLKLQKNKCACCGESLAGGYHLDHVVPISRGGSNDDSNVQLLTPTCNQKKAAKDPIDYMRSRGFLL